MSFTGRDIFIRPMDKYTLLKPVGVGSNFLCSISESAGPFEVYTCHAKLSLQFS